MISANKGTVQEPVSKEPLKLAVPIFVFVYAAGTLAKASVIIVAAVLSVAVEDAVLLPAPPVVRLNGEQPTKSGAVELTAEHSWILNCIAARNG